MKFPLPAYRKTRAFSLVELIIVIIIVAVLLGLSIPVVSSIRQAGVTAKCLSNIRQYGVALLSYAGEGNGLKIWDISTAEGKASTKPQFYKWLSEEARYLPVRPALRCPLADSPAYEHVNGRYRFPYAPNIALCATYPRLTGFPVPSHRVAIVAEVGDWDGYESRSSLNSSIWRGGEVGTEGEPRTDRVTVARYHGSPSRRGLHFFFADGSAQLVYPTDNDWTKAPVCAPLTGNAATGYFYHSSHFYNMKSGSLFAQ